MGKRKCDSVEDEKSGPPQKKSGPINFELLGSNITVLQQFVDLIVEDSDDPNSYDVVKDYLEHHDGSDLILWLKDAFSRKQRELRIILEALSAVLMRTARDLKPTHGEIGRRLGDQIMEHNVDLVMRVFQPALTSIVKKSGLKLLASLVAQDVLVAGALLKRFNWSNVNFQQLSKHRNKSDDCDVRSWFVNFVLSFFILGDNSLIRSMLDKKDVMDMVIQEAHIDKFSTAMLVIKVLHEKVVRNPSISKTQKVRLFHRRCMDFLGNLMHWRGEAKTHKEWKDRLKYPLIESDELKDNIRCIQEALLALLTDVATSTKYGIVFIDKFVGTSTTFCNANLIELFTNLDDPRESPSIKELLLKCVAVCPDIIPVYIKRLAPFLEPRPSNNWYCSMALIAELYQCVPDLVKPLYHCVQVCSPEQVAAVVANLTLTPSSLADMFTKAADKSSPDVYQKVDELVNILLGRFRLALSWVQSTEKIADATHKTLICDKLQKIVHENIQVENWCKKFLDLFNEDLFDPSLLKSEEIILYDNLEVKKEITEIPDKNILENLPKKLRRAIEKIEVVDTIEEKTSIILDYYAEYREEPLVTALCTACSIASQSMKKSAAKKLISRIFNTVVSDEKFLHLFAPASSDSSIQLFDKMKASLVDLLLLIYSKIPEKFAQRMTVIPLIAAYTATLKLPDQKLLYMIYGFEKKDLFGDIIQSPYVWGPRTHEYFKIQNDLSAVIWRQTHVTVSMNILNDDLLYKSAFNFPMKRPWLEFYKEDFQIYPEQIEVYDPCFTLHVLSSSLKRHYDELDLKSFYLKNCLIYCIAALTSTSRHIRALGKAIIVRYIDLLNDKTISRFPEQSSLLFVLNHLRYSLVSHSKTVYHMRREAEEATAGKSAKNPFAFIPSDRLSTLHAHWYMKIIVTITKPNSAIYSALWNNVLLYNPVIDLTRVPHFFIFLFSVVNYHRVLRQWILKLVSESLRDDIDFLVMENSGVFKYLMVLYCSPTFDHSSQMNIMKLIDCGVKIPRVAHYLICNHGLTIWLHRRLSEMKDPRKRDLMHSILKSLQELHCETEIGAMITHLHEEFKLCCD